MATTFLLSGLALLLYLGAEAYSIAHLRHEKTAFGLIAKILLSLGFLAHFGALEIGGRITHTVPYRDWSASMSLFAWMVAGSYGILRLRHRESSTGPFLIPVAIVFLAILGYAAFTLAFVLAQLYLIQIHQIHKRKLGLLFSRMPALDVLSRMHHTSIGIGVVSITVATTLGFIRAKQNWGTFWDPKVAITLLLIAVYVFCLLAGRLLNWSGKRIAWLSIGGYFLLLFSYTIVNLFITQEHVFR
ncbi:MAG: cytochrome c biogenesis protein CcsA [Acidobacteriota bacterium]|nr:cytochrome c biogenesis protein CcsA [Acidobacteriota bacterium]